MDTVVLSILLGIPLIGSVLIALGLGGRRYPASGIIGSAAIAISLVMTVVMLVSVVSAPEAAKSTTITLWTWLAGGKLLPGVGVQFTVDPLSLIMAMVITGVGFLIHIYSIGYMAEDEGFGRFFSYMNLFIFSMLILVFAADFVILIVGWALVALSSYLLIGFWYERPSAVAAARKAFVTQVVGDVALVLAAFMFVLGVTSGTNGSGSHIYSLSLPVLFAHAGSFTFGGAYITTACILVAIGAFAKSAQFPLHTWLPDAMEGPTPVSALIHAATMVTAGVYLIARFAPLFSRAPIASGVVACVGIGTAFMAGLIALTQNDIKRVIAYSTMSQIGLMIYATGIGAYGAAMYHFMMHAVFKALLFMAAGNVIHGLGGEQDIRSMGGLGKRLRLTEGAFLSGTFALAGIPIFAGWWSKEGLLGFGLVNGPGTVPWVLYIVGIAINILTGLYALRLFGKVFRGAPQTKKAEHPHAVALSAAATKSLGAFERAMRPFFSWPLWLMDRLSGRKDTTPESAEGPLIEAPLTMIVPVLVLATLSAIIGLFLEWPFTVGHTSLQLVSSFLAPVFAGVAPAATPSVGSAWAGLAIGTACSIVGVGFGYHWWVSEKEKAAGLAMPSFLVQVASSKFYFDELYDYLFVRPTAAVARGIRRVAEPRGIDGFVNGVGDFLNEYSDIVRGWQTGFLRDYASVMVGFAALIVVLTAILVVRS